MTRHYLSNFSTALTHSLFAFLSVAVLTIVLKLIGRDVLGEAVIALLYLVPVGWSAARWGQGAGVSAAVMAALAFDYFFIPPFYTFEVGLLEGWLVLAILLTVSIVVVGRIQTGLTRAITSEREAIFMYELSSSLAGVRTQEAVVRTLAKSLQEMFHSELVKVWVQPVGGSQPIIVFAPPGVKENGVPDRILPIMAFPGMLGEIQLWRGYGWLPAEGSRLLSNINTQAAQALERSHLLEVEALASHLMNNKPAES